MINCFAFNWLRGDTRTKHVFQKHLTEPLSANKNLSQQKSSDLTSINLGRLAAFSSSSSFSPPLPTQSVPELTVIGDTCGGRPMVPLCRGEMWNRRSTTWPPLAVSSSPACAPLLPSVWAGGWADLMEPDKHTEFGQFFGSQSWCSYAAWTDH